jgi:hypothetical protein
MKCKQTHINTIAVLFISAFIIYACEQNKNSKIPDNKDTVELVKFKADSITIKNDMHYYWEAVPDDKSNRLIMKRLQPLSDDSLTTAHLISRINSRYDHIKLQFVKISNDTVFVKIRQADFLTQQMGSTGADMYLTEATYNLSELNNIGYVHFDFKNGDHASPGTYSRADFVNIKFSSQ